ncbi:DUF4012 domain-containing protein [Microbacterium sp. LRZ72]|uniref:DUF4012 domain-containing protein n=1 Tax=Microbacterium sp. LRZ72 TaxID=2942481 RepID=UPI0029B1A353|nr:DUF4012 domain-containing protein [Microbacterium sp. LRZ72]MDX2377009.1 DUF4012 domain-containing protein [Microbacterium sp. LRZ72]
MTADASTRSARRAAAPPPRRRRTLILGIVVLVLVALVAAAVWVGLRALAAKDALESAVGEATQLQQQVLAGDLAGLDTRAQAITRHARDAAASTGDPIWRAAELVPLVGANLRAVREVTEIAEDLAVDGVPPLLTAASEVDIDALGLTEGRVGLAGFAAAEPALADAAGAFSAASERAQAIDTFAALPVVAGAVDEMRGTLLPAAGAVDALARAATLLPPMLGAEEPREYLLLMQNNAEVRSSGGIPGAFAVLRAEDGVIELVTQASTADFRRFDDPILPLDAATVALFDDQPGQYVQHALQIPDFPTAAPLAAEFWQRTMGDRVDGVIAVDTVVLSHILDATGSLQAGPYELTAGNAVGLLLSDVYRDFTAPSQQDAVFEAAATGVFAAVTDGRAASPALIEALGEAGTEGRVRVWSAHDGEQRMLAQTTLAGALPEDDEDAVVAAVYFNDSTGAKMNYYTDAEITAQLARCEEEATLTVQVRWSSSAPADAATSLPVYVTGNGSEAVPTGQTRTRIAVYGPQGWLAASSSLDGAAAGAQATIDHDRPVIQYETTLEPGGSTLIEVAFTGPDPGAAEIVATPLLRDAEIDTTVTGCQP